MKSENYIQPVIKEEEYGYRLRYNWFAKQRVKWLTNWIFYPQTIFRRRRVDGTYEEMLEGYLRYFYGTGKDDHESIKFCLWDDMFNSIVSLNKMHPACNQFAAGKQVDLLKAFIWQQASAAKCPVRSLKADIKRRKQEIHNKQSAASARKKEAEKKEVKEVDMNWDDLKI